MSQPWKTRPEDEDLPVREDQLPAPCDAGDGVTQGDLLRERDCLWSNEKTMRAWLTGWLNWWRGQNEDVPTS